MEAATWQPGWRQGYQENYVNGNFDDYISQGIGMTPMAWIYQNQLVSHALAKKGVGADMVLIYPQPTITNKVVFVATNERAKALGSLLSTNPELQGIALEYGFRIPEAVGALTWTAVAGEQLRRASHRHHLFA